ncbi:macrophage mannose receptor 1-like [Centroberyx affinis]|uniref:macrophage mannose receptor 1-like n=1 Tax=Centroberyx affinis TaxID=166261 RepID=UPI003A5BD2FC
MKMQWSLFLIILMGQCSSSTCQPHVYHFIKEAKTWDEAQRYCRKKYTDLATIDNMEDMKRLIDSAGGGNSDAAWIGLKKTGDREWHWSLPGTEYNKNETRWASDEPNDCEGRENCVWMKTNGSWIDIRCNDKAWFICYDGTKNNTNKFCLIEEEKTWREAQDYCREKHTDLISGNQTFNEQVLSKMNRPDPSARYVIGLFRDSWKWSDRSNSSFRYWHQSVNANHQGQNRCAWTRLDEQGRWKHGSCSKNLSFFCYDDRVILIREEKTWDEALDYCREKHDDLVSILDPDIQKLVQERAKTANTPYVWLGMRYTCTLDFWFWVSDGAGCYENWAPGNRNGDCGTAAAMEKGGGQWVSLPDDEEYNFICTK